MTFLREIPADKVTNEVLSLDQYGFTLVYKQDSVEVWADAVQTSIYDTTKGI
jgi:hypothetical protein